jgi:ATP-dependent DNA helicase RecQ
VPDEKTFAVFSHLREIRKKIAEEDGLPVYAVFTDEEPADIAGLKEITTDNLKKVKDIGEGKRNASGNDR